MEFLRRRLNNNRGAILRPEWGEIGRVSEKMSNWPKLKIFSEDQFKYRPLLCLRWTGGSRIMRRDSQQYMSLLSNLTKCEAYYFSQKIID